MITIHVKHGPNDVAVEIEPDATVAALKERLEAATGVFARHQKLIFRGKVLEGGARLDACKVGDGAKVMLLVTQGTAAGAQQRQPVKGAPAAAGAAPRQTVAELLAARKQQLQQRQQGAEAFGGGAGISGSGSGNSSSAAARTLEASLPERRAAWRKTGVVALRDLALAAVPAGCFDGDELADARSADLSQNRLEELPASIGRLASLSSLRLADNALTDAGVPWAALAGLTGLTLLALDRNALTALPAALGACSGLVRLSAAGNAIASIEDGALAGLAALRELDVSANALAALPEAIGGCTSLVDLDADDNAIAAIPASVTRLQRLQSLRMDNNRVKALPEGLFASCTSLAALLLRGNPITVEALRNAPSFAAYEERRRARTNKQLGGRVMSDIERAFCEGADVEQWQHYRK